MTAALPPPVPPPPVRVERRRPPVAVAGDGRRRGQIDTARTRLTVGAGVFGLLFLALAARLVDVSLLAEGQPRIVTVPQAVLMTEPRVERASIVDRNGVLLAASLPTAALYANPREIADPVEAARRLAAALPDIDPALLAPRLEGDRQFVYIRRHLTPREQDAVNRLGIPGVYFQRAERRVYPQGHAAVHVLGGTDVDGTGIAGVERAFDARLREGVGTPLRLSLDIRVQHVLRAALAGAISRFEAIGGAGVVMDVTSGEVLAMVSLPDHDPAEIATAPAEARFNRITVGVYEPGSTFKILSTAMALDLGTVRLTSGFDASRPITYGRFTIRDFRGKNRWLTVPEIFAYSSNIGTARMVLEVGVPRHRAFLERLGMTRRVGIELPETALPLAPSPRHWREINTLTIAFGHGISVTPLHVATATAAMVNGGVLRTPTLLARDPDAARPAGERVIRPETSATIRRLMRLTVTHGSGKGADVPGYFVGGKTGTAQKVGANGRYVANARISSFTGIFPAHAPRYVVYLMVDEPKPQRDTHGFATGGWVAAPAAKEVIERIGPLLGVVPEPETDAIRAALAITLPGQAPAARPAPPPAQRQAALSAPERRVAAQ
jgi:cell division protein FtsI (penicillin-binding protein 3)